ncbi:tripartite tricarboxylate transporter TctB family protein [Bradyrhizobium canariense]|uniref:Tripartite tricarboxylate transporter TctB family protein n=1 Tax=Bradyrhizobium canariense TaxID=255045 RepID=A0A1H2BDD9_9BRAD|nr:tripartite tricarboxylate transporter TctB family protein [Bradyrhizobium canariense]SDT56164.1 Tripartite tricarboxylate transporter TctB family protein [Bradyrhizobium canariense]
MRADSLRFFSDNSDRICGIIATTVAIFLYLNAAGLPFGTMSAPDAGFFPKSLSAIMAVLGVGMMFRSRSGKQEHANFTLRSWAVPLAAVVLLAYALLLNKVGFVLSTIAVLFLLMTAYGRLCWIVALSVSVSAVAICYFGFTELGVPLPQGVLSIF